ARLLEGQRRGLGKNTGCLHDHLRRIATLDRVGDDLVAGMDRARWPLGPVGNRGDHSGDLPPETHREPRRIPAEGTAVLPVVDGIGAGGAYLESHLAPAGMTDWRLDHGENLRPTE